MKKQENEPVEAVQPNLGGHAPADSPDQQSQPKDESPEANQNSGETATPATVGPSSSATASTEAAPPKSQQTVDDNVIGILEQLQSIMAERLRYDDLKEQMFSALHEELKGYKQDALAQAKKPLINDLLLL